MGSRAVSLVGSITWLAAVLGLAATASAGGGGSRTKITVWDAAPPAPAGFGGLTYGGHAPTTGALIVDQREVELAGDELRIAGVAATLDPASVQLRDLTDPTTTLTEQRFLPGATSPTQLLQQHVGAPVTIGTPDGELTGVLRAIDDAVVVVEVGSGAQPQLRVLRRAGYVQDVRLPAGARGDRPSLVWRVRARGTGPHAVELTYRAEGLSWTADYLAVLDDAARAVDFAAWATVHNASGVTFDRAELTLVSGGNAGPTVIEAGPSGTQARTPAATPTRYAIGAPVRLVDGQAVQVELIPRRRAAAVRPVVTYEALPDPSSGFQAYPNTDCNQFRTAGAGRAEVALELDVPGRVALPDGRVRAYRRRADHLELVSEEPLRASPGLARIRLSDTGAITGLRRALTCNHDERARTLTERIEVTVENQGDRAAEVVIREFAWRWPVWKLDAEDAKSARAGAQALEYRVKVPAGGKRTVTYGVSYTW